VRTIQVVFADERAPRFEPPATLVLGD
jgi:hypothetical protein